MTSYSTHKIDEQETDGVNSKIRQSRYLIDINSVELDLRRKFCSGSISFFNLGWLEEECIWVTDGNYNQHLLPKFVCIYWNVFLFAATSTLIRFQTKTELFCSVFKKICVHTYRFRIVSFSLVHTTTPFCKLTVKWSGARRPAPNC